MVRILIKCYITSSQPLLDYYISTFVIKGATFSRAKLRRVDEQTRRSGDDVSSESRSRGRRRS